MHEKNYPSMGTELTAVNGAVREVTANTKVFAIYREKGNRVADCKNKNNYDACVE